MRRSKPVSGGRTTSDRAASAIDIMYRARDAHVFSSPMAWDSGLPIIRVMSRAMASAFFSRCSTARSQTVMRSCSLLAFHTRAAARTRSRVAPMNASSASRTSHAGSPVNGLSTTRVRGSLEVAARRRLRAGELLRLPLEDDAPAVLPRLGAELDHPVGARDDVGVVLDDDERVAALDQPLEHAEEAAHVRQVEPGRRLVEDVDRGLVRAPRVSSAASLRRCASPPESVFDPCPICT
jgi:hypothetical protein